MNVGIIGSGVVGQQLGLGFLKSGYKVKIGTRDAPKLNDWLNTAGVNASVGSFKDAASFGELIVLATSWAGIESAINLAGKENFKGKVTIDVTNPLDFSQGAPPKFAASLGNSLGEQIQRWLPDTKIVKAFNTISAFCMINPKREEGMPDLFIAGNENEAKKIVSDIAQNWGWISVIDLGEIPMAYWLETFAMLWIYYGFKYNNWTHAFKLLKK
ncbi:MAG: NAD(P)-binding domain-containing protein [Ignavibacteriales bacterium]|nr:NAD(P)-binding domain-containing protein [Ignavibacteriales bacterium]